MKLISLTISELIEDAKHELSQVEQCAKRCKERKGVIPDEAFRMVALKRVALTILEERAKSHPGVAYGCEVEAEGGFLQRP